VETAKAIGAATCVRSRLKAWCPAEHSRSECSRASQRSPFLARSQLRATPAERASRIAKHPCSRADLIGKHCCQCLPVKSTGCDPQISFGNPPHRTKRISFGNPTDIVKRDTITTPFGRHEWVTVSVGSISGWKVRLQVLPRLPVDIPVETNGVVQVKYTNPVQIRTDLNHVRPDGSGGKVCF